MRLGERTLVMGILNTTPDSFSDGGSFSDPSHALEHALEMVGQGADIIDIGGESTRPGASPVDAAEEIRRTVPLIEKLRSKTDIPISIDTTKAEVARAALDAGADIINDVSAFATDGSMAEVAAKAGAGVILMHMKGSPKTMQHHPEYESVIGEVAAHLNKRIDCAVASGVDRECIVVDPGIGFGKTVQHNVELLHGIETLLEIGRPLLIGASRKSMIGHLLGRSDPSQRIAGSLGIAAWAVMNNVHILRVHDVLDTCDVCRIVDTIRCGEQ